MTWKYVHMKEILSIRNFIAYLLYAGSNAYWIISIMSLVTLYKYNTNTNILNLMYVLKIH